MYKQFTLDLFRHEFDNFIITGNELIVSNLQNPASQYIHIYGDELSGKTHLLQSAVHAMQQSALYTSCISSMILAFDELIMYDLLAFDDIDHSSLAQQEVLFNLFNYTKNHSHIRIISSSTQHPHKLELRDDLKTRIYAGFVARTTVLRDKDLLICLSEHTSTAGINISTAELEYILNNFERNFGELIDFINQLSLLAIAAHKTITIPFIKAVAYEYTKKFIT